MTDQWLDVRDHAGRLLHRERIEVDPLTRATVLLYRWLQLAEASDAIDSDDPLACDTRSWIAARQRGVEVPR